MAKVTIENAEVTKHLGDKGFIAEVRYKTRTGEEKVEKWTVWGKLAEIGQVFTITGDLTIKTEEFDGAEGKVRYARGHVNNPVFSFDVPFGTSLSGASEKKGHAALNDVWPAATPGGIADEAPF